MDGGEARKKKGRGVSGGAAVVSLNASGEPQEVREGRYHSRDKCNRLLQRCCSLQPQGTGGLHSDGTRRLYCREHAWLASAPLPHSSGLEA